MHPPLRWAVVGAVFTLQTVARVDRAVVQAVQMLRPGQAARLRLGRATRAETTPSHLTVLAVVVVALGLLVVMQKAARTSAAELVVTVFRPASQEPRQPTAAAVVVVANLGAVRVVPVVVALAASTLAQIRPQARTA